MLRPHCSQGSRWRRSIIIAYSVVSADRERREKEMGSQQKDNTVLAIQNVDKGETELSSLTVPIPYSSAFSIYSVFPWLLRLFL